MAMVYLLLLPFGGTLISCGLCYFFMLRFWGPAVGLSLAGLLGFWCGDMLLYQRVWPGFPPTDPSVWWVFALPFMGLFAVIHRRRSFRGWSLVGMSGLSLLYVYLLTEPLRQYAWQETQTAFIHGSVWGGVLVGLPLLIAAFYASSSASSQPSSFTGTWPLVMGLMTAGSGILFLMGSSAVYAQAAFSLCGIQLLTMLIFYFKAFRRHEAFSTGLVWSQTWLLAMLWINVVLFASLSPVAWIAWSGFFAPFLLYLRPISALRLPYRYLTIALVTGVCLSVAMIWVWMIQPHAEIYL